MRRPSSFGPEEKRPPPEVRTSANFTEDGLANEKHEHALRCPDARRRRVYKKDLPYKRTGPPFPWLHASTR